MTWQPILSQGESGLDGNLGLEGEIRSFGSVDREKAWEGETWEERTKLKEGSEGESDYQEKRKARKDRKG